MSEEKEPRVVEYSNLRIRRRIPKWMVRVAVVLLPLVIYVGCYLGFGRRTYDLWGGCTITYPGAVRFYALSERVSSTLGNSDITFDEARRSGAEVLLTSDSVYVGAGWRFYLWRLFYPLERLDLWRLGEHPMAISYSGPRVAPVATASATSLPLVGPVYHESTLRNGTLYRFVAAVHEGRDGSNRLLSATDVYLFEWAVAGPWNGVPRIATRARRVDESTNLVWEHRWLADGDHYLTWDEKQRVATAREFQDELKPARVSATLDRVGPVRCNTYGMITPNRSAQLFAGERNGLFIFDARTLLPVRELKASAAMSAFFAARPDELSNKNSACFLTHDGKELIRIATTFHMDGKPDESIAVVYDIDGDTTRDVHINVGRRTDVKDVESIDGVLWFYVITADGKWTQQLRDESGTKVMPISPAQQPDMEVMAWDPAHGVLVDIPGFEANPQPLDLDSEIQVQQAAGGALERGVIRYGDSTGKPAMFRVGAMKFR